MIWFLVITNIIGWSLAISSLTMAGLLLMIQGSNLQKSANVQRPNVTPKVKMFDFEKYKE